MEIALIVIVVLFWLFPRDGIKARRAARTAARAIKDASRGAATNSGSKFRRVKDKLRRAANEFTK